MTYYRLVRKARQLYDPDPKRLQQLVGLAEPLFPVLSPLPKGVKLSKGKVAGMDCERLIPTDIKLPAMRLLFLHGGAFVFGSPKTHRSMAGFLTRELGCEAVVPAYQLAPKAQYPQQLEEVLAVYRALLDEGLPLVVAGDSAGGNLALALTHRILGEGLQPPHSLLLFSPWLDLRDTSAAAVENMEEDSLFNADDMRQYAGLYTGDARADQAGISPILGPVDELPPVFLQGALNEFLWPDFEAWIARLESEDRQFECDREEVAFHSWQLFPLYSGQARTSLERAAQFVRRTLRTAAVTK